jgi:hypothetical protein
MAMRKFLLFVCLLMTATLVHAASATAPTIDFGTVYYCPDNAGTQTVVVPDSGTITTSGTGGGIVSQSGGAAGTTQIQKSGIIEFFQSSYFYTKKSETRNTSGCGGSVTLSNTTTEGGAEEASAGIFSGSNFNVGAHLTINSFNSSTSCTLTDTFSGILSFRVGSSGSATALNLSYRVTIIPAAKLSHHNGSALNFGTLCRSSNQQTITIAPNGTISSSSVSCPVTGDVSADVFDVVAPTGFAYNISVDSSTTLSSGSNTLTVSGLTPSCTSCTMASTNDTVTVGGTLTVPASSPVGEYTGNYRVTLTY